MTLPYKRGSNGPEIRAWQDWAERYAPSYFHLLGPKDSYYGLGEEAFVKKMQQNLFIPETGVFDELTASMVNFKSKFVTAPTITQRRKIWFYSAPGSGADWWFGPSFELGEQCKNILKINHQPISFMKGGYLGLLGGDPKNSYIEVIYDQYKSLQYLLQTNPDIKDPAIEIWLSGYSQSADGMLEAANKLFGDDGEFQHLRNRINKLVLFGNPGTPKTGIARKTFPEWLNKLTVNVNTAGDFYAYANDDIRPLFYEWFIQAETEIPFVIYCAQIIIPALLNLVAPFLGGGLTGLASPVATGILAGATGLPAGLLGSLVGGVAGAKSQPNPKLIELLSIKGVLTNLPGLVELLRSLPGIQAHGEYHLPKPEFQNKTGIQVGYDVIAGFRR